MYVIIRHNTVTNHYYVHSDGQNDFISTEAGPMMKQLERILMWGSAHEAQPLGGVKNTRQARAYCSYRNDGMEHVEALDEATRTEQCRNRRADRK